MNIEYTVENISSQTRPNVASIDGATLAVIVPELEVELYDSTGKHGSLQLHFRTPEEQAYATATFKPGEKVTITLPEEPVSAEAPAENEA
jgi:hypothetical protein